MQPDRRAGRLEAGHALRQQAGHDAGEDVAGAGGRQPGRRVGVDRRAAIGCGDDGVGALEHDDRRLPLRPPAGRVRAWTCSRVGEPSPNSRPNSPSCGVRMVPASCARRDGANSRRGSSAKLVNASASRTTARSPASAASTKSQVALADAEPWPERDGVEAAGRPGMRPVRLAPSTGRTITARLAAALIASASRGEASVTRPAPARSAPRAASRAAPVVTAPPDTITACPRVYLWPSWRGTGKAWRHDRGIVLDGSRMDRGQSLRP